MESNTINRISQVVSRSQFFTEWNGYNDKHVNGVRVISSNRKLKNLKENGIDSELNLPTIKQLIQYDEKAYSELLKGGMTFIYQGLTITLRGTYKRLSITCVNGDRVDVTTLSMDNFIKNRNIAPNTNIIAVLSSLYRVSK